MNTELPKNVDGTLSWAFNESDDITKLIKSAILFATLRLRSITVYVCAWVCRRLYWQSMFLSSWSNWWNSIDNHKLSINQWNSEVEHKLYFDFAWCFFLEWGSFLSIFLEYTQNIFTIKMKIPAKALKQPLKFAKVENK